MLWSPGNVVRWRFCPLDTSHALDGVSCIRGVFPFFFFVPLLLPFLLLFVCFFLDGCGGPIDSLGRLILWASARKKG